MHVPLHVYIVRTSIFYHFHGYHSMQIAGLIYSKGCVRIKYFYMYVEKCLFKFKMPVWTDSPKYQLLQCTAMQPLLYHLSLQAIKEALLIHFGAFLIREWLLHLWFYYVSYTWIYILWAHPKICRIVLVTAMYIIFAPLV